MNHSTRSKRIRQRPKTKKIRRHQDQPLLWPDRAGLTIEMTLLDLGG